MTAPSLTLTRCRHCHSRFVPRPGPCPRCGSTDLAPATVSSIGTVRAATALEAPAPGWSSPHPLCLVELADSIWLLAIGPVPLPALGSTVEVERDGETYRVRPHAAGI